MNQRLLAFFLTLKKGHCKFTPNPSEKFPGVAFFCKQMMHEWVSEQTNKFFIDVYGHFLVDKYEHKKILDLF